MLSPIRPSSRASRPRFRSSTARWCESVGGGGEDRFFAPNETPGWSIATSAPSIRMFRDDLMDALPVAVDPDVRGWRTGPAAGPPDTPAPLPDDLPHARSNARAERGATHC